MRASGILMHISSLPSPYGIGTLGREARDFVDFLAAAGQSYWQVLPMNPTGYGDSPYQAFSTFAGNHYFIDLDALIAEGLLTVQEVEAHEWGEDPTKVDFGALYAHRAAVLRLAYDRFRQSPDPEFPQFVAQNADWLIEYARFMALKEEYGGAPWTSWPASLCQRDAAALHEADAVHRTEIDFHCFVQYLFFRQWRQLRAYCHEHGIALIGDVPIYVPLDSADVWSNSSQFRLDSACQPIIVAGCPPDDFNADGQLWGNPIYDWQAMRADGYRWWVRRLQAAAQMYDVVRIDHFRGFESYWAVPYGAPNARNGTWLPGPGMDLIETLHRELPELRFIAEDLGFLTPEVIALRKASGFPGMKVLEFAFDPTESSEYLPHHYDTNCVCYTGTHDNAPVQQWYDSLCPASRRFARRYLALSKREGIAWGVIRGGMASVAALFIAQLQDYLPADCIARMNAPGYINDQNWRWRITADVLTPALSRRIRTVTADYDRLGAQTKPK